MNIHRYKTGVIIVDSGGLIEDANSVATNLIGSDILNNSWSKIYLDNFSVEASGLYYSLKNDKYVRLEFNLVDDGQVIFIMDITKLIDLIGAKSKSMRLLAMGEMAGSISHQIKTPIAVASIQAEMAIEDGHDNTKINKIIDSLDSITNLLDEMLSFSVDNKVEVINSFEIIDDLMKMYQNICINRAGTDVIFVGNLKMIVNMMTNIINNSLETNTIMPVITIKSKIAGGYCVFTYTDNCGGVNQEIDIFSRNQSSKEHGSGLGMNVVKFIIEAHGGHINYERKNGDGILINILIPLEKSIQGK